MIFEDEPELTMIFALMTKQEKVEFLEKAIRDTMNPDSEKMFQYLLREVKKNG